MEIGLGAFIRFANAAPRARPRIARAIAEQARSEYDPATDFWRPMRQAISRDRKTTRDGEALRRLVDEASPRRRPSFEEISVRWGDLAPRWLASGHTSSTPSRIHLGGVQIRVSPLFSEQWTNGQVEAAHVWFNKEELCTETLHGVQHLLSRAGHPNGPRPVFVDMRRALALPATTYAGDMDGWLEDLSLEFRQIAG